MISIAGWFFSGWQLKSQPGSQKTNILGGQLPQIVYRRTRP
jgi:hypothetical protein